MSKPKLALIPSGYKAEKVYSILPNNGDGDFTFDRANGYASRVRKDGLIEEVSNDTPRLDWYNSECPSLKLEPQRLNSIIQSQDLTTSWSVFNGGSISSNEIISPNGELEADELITNGTAFSFVKPTANPTISTGNNTFTIFAKKGTSDILWLRLDYGTTIYNRKFNLTTQTISAGFDNTANIPNEESIENYGNGWYRLRITDNANTTSFEPRIYVADATSTNGDSVYLFGAQVEQGSHPTSYIKTEGGTVTRFKDNCHLLSQTLFTDYPFTVYAKAKVEGVGNSIFSIVDSTNANKYLTFNISSSTQVAVFRRDTTNNDADYHNFSYSIRDTIKVAIAFISDTAYKLYINGTELADVTSGLSVPFDHNDIALGQLRIASDSGARNSIDDFRVFETQLTDAELTELTT